MRQTREKELNMEKLTMITVTRLPDLEGGKPEYQLLGYLNGKCVLNVTGDKKEIADTIFAAMEQAVL